jgi:phosphatidylethanolamine-binding protein (PEBP) family uncharacterized protein
MMLNKKTTLFFSLCLLLTGACNNDKFIKPNKLVSIQLDQQMELKTGDKKDKLLACVKVVGAENDPNVAITIDKSSPDADFFQLGKDEQKCGALPALLLNKDLPNDFDITKPLQVKLIATRGNETKHATFTFTVIPGEGYIKPSISDILLSKIEIAESANIDEEIGVLRIEGTAENVVFSLDGGNNDDFVKIENDKLLVNNDLTGQKELKIKIKASNEKTTLSKDFTITVKANPVAINPEITDVNINLSSISILESTTGKIAELSVTGNADYNNLPGVVVTYTIAEQRLLKTLPFEIQNDEIHVAIGATLLVQNYNVTITATATYDDNGTNKTITKDVNVTITVEAEPILPPSISSMAIKNGYIGVKYTDDNSGNGFNYTGTQNISPEITVSNIPADVTTIAIMIVDLDYTTWSHGLGTVNVSSNSFTLAEGGFNAGLTLLDNDNTSEQPSKATETYEGPHPPSKHTYAIRAYFFKNGDTIPTTRQDFLGLTEDTELTFYFDPSNPGLGNQP